MEKQFKKFEPMTQVVNRKVEELVKRGGVIIEEKKSHVLIKRLNSVAKIDQWGRVEWTPE
jgi:hypothetical protein